MKNYIFYHMYPLGMLQKEGGYKNIKEIQSFIPHLQSLSVNAVYLGPVFESISHGYDTVDYYQVDKRLGSNQDLKQVVKAYKKEGIEIVLDGVFHHVSREFFAFVDVRRHREKSKYADWFHIDFSEQNTQDGFSYKNWDGHNELVKLNLQNPEVASYIFQVVRFWIQEFEISGLRLDAADVMDRTFIRQLTRMTKSIKSDFFVMGEMVHGEYGKMLEETEMDSLSNYECYKGLYSSLNDRNYYEIAHSFERLLGENSDTSRFCLYNFVDNHDVNRVVSVLEEERKLYPLYIMLYTMKGIPSLYYKSEIGQRGKRSATSDTMLRPSFSIDDVYSGNQDILATLKILGKIRKNHSTLCDGKQVTQYISHGVIAYERQSEENTYVIIINQDHHEIHMSSIKKFGEYKGYDVLNKEHIDGNQDVLYPNWGRIIRLE